MGLTTVVFQIKFVLLLFVSSLPNQSGPSETQAKMPDQDRKEIRQVEQSQDSVSTSIFLDSIEIQGRVEKPQTVFILPGKDPEVDTIQIDRSFFQEIFRRVEKDMLSRRGK